MRGFRLVSALTLSLAASPVAGHADPVLVQAAGSTRTVACADAPAMIEGARNLITFTGHCTSLQIRGDSNIVSIPLAEPGNIDIEGNGNRIRYTAAAGVRPQLRIVGNGIWVTPSAYSSAPPAALATISGNGLNLDLDCDGLAFTLDSVGSTVALRGQCKAVLLHGETNLVRADLAPAASVTIEGNANTLLYRLPPGAALPGGKVTGMGSFVAADSGLAASLGTGLSPVKLPVPLLMRLLDAQVQAPGTLVILQPAIFGRSGFSPAGEVMLQRLGGLLVQAWPSSVRIVGHNANPERAKQMASAVQEYLIDHGVPGLAAQIASEGGDGSVEVWLLK